MQEIRKRNPVAAHPRQPLAFSFAETAKVGEGGPRPCHVRRQWLTPGIRPGLMPGVKARYLPSESLHDAHASTWAPDGPSYVRR
jgi:hypothetical protein